MRDLGQPSHVSHGVVIRAFERGLNKMLRMLDRGKDQML